MEPFTHPGPARIIGLWGVLSFCVAGCGQSPTVAAHGKQVNATASIPDPLVIQLTGTEHRWQAKYPDIGGRGSVIHDMRPGERLHVPQGSDVVLVLKSKDYIYTLAIPELGLKQVAVPDLEFRLSFRPSADGLYSLIGDELCGLQQSDQSVQLVAEPREQFLQYLSRSSAKDESF